MKHTVRFGIIGITLASAGLLVGAPLGLHHIQATTDTVSLPVELAASPVELVTPSLDLGIASAGTEGSFADSLNGMLGLLGDLGTVVSDLETPTNPAFSGIGSDLGNPDIGNLFGNLLGMLSGDLGNSNIGNAFSQFDSLVTGFSNMLNELFSQFSSISGSAAAEIATDLTMPF